MYTDNPPPPATPFDMFSTHTIFARNVQNVNTVITNADSQNKIMIDYYEKLATYVRTIRTLLNQYAQAEFYTVANILTQTVYKKMSVELNALAMNSSKYANYETLRLGTVSALEGLYQSILQYATLVDTEYQLEKALEYKVILNDPVKLNEYIEKLKGRRYLFNPEPVTVVPATVKPEYLQYIKLYGYPKGGVFDMDKLARILKDLGMT